ncbi:hypothetical protein FRC07_011259 [Ceratobasidium sp. 392]|nr:hypothetical protein FRC07_011259 [Ceratobasidium sp. 392]
MSLRDPILKIWRAGEVFGRITVNDYPQLPVDNSDTDSQTQHLDTSHDPPWAEVITRRRANSEPSFDNQSFVTAPTIAPTQHSYDYEESISLLSIPLSNDNYLPEVDFGELWRLSSQNDWPLGMIVAQLAPIPSIETLVGCLTSVFRVVQKSRVNKEQWKLLQRCVTATRIAGAEVTRYGGEYYPDLQEATNLLRNTLDRIGERANHWNQMHELVTFVQFPEISEEIRPHFVTLDSCLSQFTYATDVVQLQWINEFNDVQKAETEQLERMYTLIEGTITKLDVIGQPR